MSVWVPFILSMKNDESLIHGRGQCGRCSPDGWKSLNLELFDAALSVSYTAWMYTDEVFMGHQFVLSSFIFSCLFRFQWIYISASQNWLMIWKHRTDVFRWNSIPALLSLCLTLVSRAAIEGTSSGFSCFRCNWPVYRMSICLYYHIWVSVGICHFHGHISALWC